MKKKIKTEPIKYVAVELSSSQHGFVNSNRYLAWIDEHWYESTSTRMNIFPESQIPQIKSQLKKHFHNYAAFIDEDGNTTIWNSYAENCNTTKKKKSINGISFVLKTVKL